MSMLSSFARPVDSLTRRGLLGGLSALLAARGTSAAAGEQEGRDPIDPEPHVAYFKLAGHSYRVRVWTNRQWDELAESERPDAAFRIGDLGWAEIKPHAAQVDKDLAVYLLRHRSPDMREKGRELYQWLEPADRLEVLRRVRAEGRESRDTREAGR